MRFSNDVSSAGDSVGLKPLAKPQPEEWEELCHSLLTRLSQKSAECEGLGTRVRELEERLQAAEAERVQANAMAEDLYEFFRSRAREIGIAGRGSGGESPIGSHLLRSIVRSDCVRE